jgi:spermidine/putrescine-binding protein
MYNEELVPEGVDSWEAFWGPDFEGKTALVDKPKDQFLSSMLRLGLDFTDPKVEDFEQVKQSMKDRVKNMRTLWTSEDEAMRLMINKEVVLADAYDGLTAQIAAEYPAIKYQVPKEGTYGWFDGPVLLKGAPHPNLAYKWIDFVTSPEMAKLVAEQVFYSPGNSEVPEMISPELRTQLNLDNPDETLAGLQFWVNLGPEWDRRINDAWTEAKAEAGG